MAEGARERERERERESREAFATLLALFKFLAMPFVLQYTIQL